MRDARTATRPGLPGLAGTIAVVSALTLAAVWTLQSRGYTPCELCLKERIPFYIACPLAAVLAILGARAPGALARLAFGVLALLFVAGAGLGLYHAGVELQLWAGPTECSGAVTAPAAVSDFLKQLDSVTVVRCDEAALEVLGLSLAAWNALLCTVLAAASVTGLVRIR